MKKYRYINFLLILVTEIASAQYCDTKDAKNYLDNLFRNGKHMSYDSTNFPRYSKEVQLLKTPTLHRLLPNYCFFKTTFYSLHLEYRNVTTALALSKDSKRLSYLIHSSTFTQESESFIHLFYGLVVSDTNQKVTAAKEITSIISDITYEGHFHRLTNLKDKTIISFKLWHDDLSWRIYDFYFDSTNKLFNIEIKTGVKRQSILYGYQRL